MISKYIKKTLTLCLLVLVSKLQAQKISDLNQIGGSGSEKSSSLASDSKNSLINLGKFNSSITFDSAGTSKTINTIGGIDYYLSKFDCSNNFQWAIPIGSTNSDGGGSFFGEISVDDSDNIYVVGSFYGTCYFKSTDGQQLSITSSGDLDGFLCKYNSKGKPVWVNRVGGGGIDEASAVFFNKKTNFVSIGGVISSTATFTTTSGSSSSLTSSGSVDAYYSVYDYNGILNIARKGGGSGDDLAHSIFSDDSNSVYISGNFGYSSVSATFGSFTVNNSGSWGAFVTKYDSAGNCKWVVSAGSSGTEGSRGVLVDREGNVYFTFIYEASTKLNSTSGGFLNINSIGGVYYQCAALGKVNNSGKICWAKSFNGNGFNNSWTASLSKNGFLSLGGFFSSDTLFFNNNIKIVNHGDFDMFIASFDTSGTCKWAKSIGGPSYDYWGGHCLDKWNNLIGGIYFNDSCYFDTTVLHSKGNEDAATFRIRIPQNYDLEHSSSTLKCSNDSSILYDPLNSSGDTNVIYQWFKDSISIAGATKPYFVAHESGVYRFIRSGYCQTDTSTYFELKQLNYIPVSLGSDTIYTHCSDTAFLDSKVVGSKYLWSNGEISQSIAVTSSGLYSVLVYDSLAGCYGSDTVYVQINNIKVNLGNDTLVCGGPLLLDANVSGATYKWGDGSTNQTYSANQAGKKFYKVEASKGGCKASDSIEVNISRIVINLGNDTALCSDSFVLDAQNSGKVFFWNDSSSNQKLITYTSGSYWVMVSDAITGCSAIDTISIVLENLKVSLGPDTTVCSSSSVTLDAGISAASYNWNTGATSQTINTNSAGNYWVKVQKGTCTSYDTLSINYHILSVDLGPDKLACPGSSINLDAGVPNKTYTWNTGQISQTISVDTAGNYWVMVLDSATGCWASDTITISFKALSLSLGNDTTVCNSTVDLDAGNSGATYTWSTGQTTQKVIITQPGNHTVVVDVKAGLCSLQDTIMITINSTKVSLGNDTSICVDSLVLDAQNSGSQFSWSTGSTDQALIVNQSGWYSVLVTNSLTGCSAQDSVHVSLDKVIVDLGNDTSLCGGSVFLDAGNSGSIYQWNLGYSGQAWNATQSGTYIVKVLKGSCYLSDTIRVDINPVPDSNFTFTINSGNQVEFVSSANSLHNFNWEFGDGDTSAIKNPNHTYATQGTYTVNMKVSNSQGCEAQSSKIIGVFTGLTSLESGLQFSVYPNPTSGPFKLEYKLSKPQLISISIFDLTGKCIKNIYQNEWFSNKGNHQMDINELSSGTYIIQIVGDDNITNLKVVKND
jgi:hypothetical protein